MQLAQESVVGVHDALWRALDHSAPAFRPSAVFFAAVFSSTISRVQPNVYGQTTTANQNEIRISIAERKLELYIILLTAKSSKANMVEGLMAGANDYLTKPFDRDELRARVNVGETVLDLQQKLGKTT